MPYPIHDIFMDKLFQGLDKFTEEETGTYVAKVREGPLKKKNVFFQALPNLFLNMYFSLRLSCNYSPQWLTHALMKWSRALKLPWNSCFKTIPSEFKMSRPRSLSRPGLGVSFAILEYFLFFISCLGSRLYQGATQRGLVWSRMTKCWR